jgi:ActR/RegA family two-component response regulator
MMKKLLIVDDQELYLNSLSFAMQKHFDVIIAMSKEEAIEKLKKEDVDIALIDIRLDETKEGNIDGLKLLEWISMNKPNISTYIMSAYREFIYAEQALNLGARHFFRKPIDIISLIAVIKEKG